MLPKSKEQYSVTFTRNSCRITYCVIASAMNVCRGNFSLGLTAVDRETARAPAGSQRPRGTASPRAQGIAPTHGKASSTATRHNPKGKCKGLSFSSKARKGLLVPRASEDWSHLLHHSCLFSTVHPSQHSSGFQQCKHLLNW